VRRLLGQQRHDHVSHRHPRQVGNDALSITVIYHRLKRRRAERDEIGAFSDRHDVMTSGAELAVRSTDRSFCRMDGVARRPGAFDSGTIDAQTGRARLRALRLPNPPFEPAFEHFQPF
jgi:hypothetical protein